MFKFNRKNFIKIVAAVGAATMLGACAQTAPDVDKDGEAAFQPQTKTVTFVNEDERVESFTIDTKGYGMTHDGYVQVDLTMTNRMDSNVEIASPAEEVDDGNLVMTAAAYFDGSYAGVLPIKDGVDSLVSQVLPKYADNVSYSLDGAMYFKAPDDWTKVTIVFTIDNGESVQEIQFLFNK